MTQLSLDSMLKEISACDDKIQAITGKKPILFRAPYGDYNNTLIEALNSTGRYGIQWDVDSLDWKGISADQITQRVLSKVKSGSIVLFHNAALHTPEALPGIIESLQKQGYKIIPISQLIYKDNYTIDNAGRQHPTVQTSSAPLV
jgi:peptidoglycan/xylan/chitin deacetylase (PgdA/CDA1 family)